MSLVRLFALAPLFTACADEAPHADDPARGRDVDAVPALGADIPARQDAPESPVADAAVFRDAASAPASADRRDAGPRDAPAGSASADAEASRAWPTVQDFGARGPSEPITLQREGPNCMVSYPSDLGSGGRTHPIIVWGNGTWRPATDYQRGIEHWASHGFVVVAPQDDGNTVSIDVGKSFLGDGVAMLACLDHIVARNQAAGPFMGKLDVERVGVSGHSQGAGGAVMLATDPRVKAAVPMATWTGASNKARYAQLKAPMFIQQGDKDNVAPPEQAKPVYEASKVAFWGYVVNGGHNEALAESGAFGRIRGPATAWFRWLLMNDQEAKKHFVGADCRLCNSPDWTKITKKGID